MTYSETTIYKLRKPSGSEIYDIDGFHNISMDRIEQGLVDRCRYETGSPIVGTTTGVKGDLWYNNTQKELWQCAGGTNWTKLETGKTYTAGVGVEFTAETITGATINVKEVKSVRDAATAQDDLFPSEKAVRTELDKKVDKSQGTANANKVFITDNTGNAALTKDLTVDSLKTKSLTVQDSATLKVDVSDPDGAVILPEGKKVFYKSAVDTNELAVKLDVDNEKTARETAITAEATTRATKDTALETKINNEITRSTTKDTELTSDLADEIVRATDREDVLEGLITDEENRAKGAESALDTRLDTIEAGYLVSVETTNTSGALATDGKIKFTASPAAGSKTIGIYTGLSLDNNGINVNERKTIRNATEAQDDTFPSEKATRTELDKKEDLVNKTDAPGSGDYDKHNLYPSLIFLRDYIVKRGNPSDTVSGDIVNDLLGGGADGGKNKALSAAMGKELADMVADVSTIGRYLSSWNCVTGLPGTNPSTMPYTYKTGDYYVVSAVAAVGDNLRPTGTTYDGHASTVKETAVVKINDMFRFDGTNWILSSQEAHDVSFSSLIGNPRDNSKLKAELDAKLDLAGGDMSGIINMGNYKITNLATPVSNTDATNKSYVDTYVDTEQAKCLLLNGTRKMTGDLDMDGHVIKLTQTTFNDTEAINKKFVADNYLPLIGGTLDGTLKMGKSVSGTMIYQSIEELKDPTNDHDAANKKYVDSHSGITDVTALPTSDVNKNLIYRVTDSGVVSYYQYDGSAWHEMFVNLITSTDIDTLIAQW